MSALPNFSEFYQLPLVAIGPNDLYSLQGFPSATHWLIVLVGYESELGTNIENWRVFVFTACNDGSFDYDTPEYISNPFTTIHLAFEFARKIESYCKCDEFKLHTQQKENF
ncbi:hypothetical protein [Ferdinandcohnia sp. Marseille-Q9671]